MRLSSHVAVRTVLPLMTRYHKKNPRGVGTNRTFLRSLSSSPRLGAVIGVTTVVVGAATVVVGATGATEVVGATGTTVVVTAGTVVSTTVVAVGAGCGSANVETGTGEETTFALSLATI